MYVGIIFENRFLKLSASTNDGTSHCCFTLECQHSIVWPFEAPGVLPNDSLTPKTSDFHSESLIFIGIGHFLAISFLGILFFWEGGEGGGGGGGGGEVG